ncbi:TerD family protein [Nonomuraea aurantiaca]|uniref:TerD family protein n=1 Tax=Nonomuraea aurantiaca TaxID=2878562 RepID=UPI001CD94A79|nr:TerD family protein [Nonomuraea aurantiaca]MCA2223840.1 TerD family protein [Nonomuraea aurantiaca]
MNGPAEILLRRTRVVAPALLATDPRVPEAVGELPKRLNMTGADVRSGVAALEFELLQLGFLVSAELYRALAALSSKELTRVGRRLLHILRGDLETLLEAFWPESGDWLPESVPVKETRAVVLAVALRRDAPELLSKHLETATDVLRLLYVLMDADPGLRIRPRRRVSLPRAVRRTLLSCLDAMPYAIEDLLRYGEQWKRMAEVLHPHEQHARYPNAALAFAALRGTRLDPGTAFGRTLLELAARRPGLLRVRDGRLVATSFASRVETDTPASEPAPAGLAGVAARVAPGVLIAALGQLRTPPGGRRLFLPRGGTARFHTRPDDRPPLPDEIVLEAERTLAAELLRRAAALPSLRRVLLDEGLADLVAPTSERTAVKALVRLPRGSLQPIPAGERLRFFLHWAEPKGTLVDLDLSVAVFDERWAFVGVCDYTQLRLGTAVTHSGDLTSAPEPLGSSEFIDVNVRALRGRYLVPVVFSYNDVPFEELVRGFAGFMEQPEGLFDPLAVRQRFDLTGQAKILVPLVADLWTRTMRWADFNLSAAGFRHSVAGSADELSLLGAALEQAFTHRVTLWEVGCRHAAARATEVLVRDRHGELVRYERRPGEDVAAFADRLMARADAPPVGRPASFDGVELAMLVHGDLPLPGGCAAYALHPDGLGDVRRLGAADLLSELSPDPVKVAT